MIGEGWSVPRAEPAPVLPILGVLGADGQLAEQAIAAFSELHGEVALRGPVVPFDDTDYYEPELGSALTRQYLAFSALFAAEQLAELKEQATELEQRFAAAGRRRINLDPGYIDATKVVLASYKVGPQKLHVGRGVWADLVLWYSHGQFQRLPWTFPDLQSEAHLPLFERARGHYKGLARAWRRELR
jgi:hypothetical protein